MTSTRYAIAALIVLGLITVPLAAQTPTPTQNPTATQYPTPTPNPTQAPPMPKQMPSQSPLAVGSTVTITSCVAQGQDDDHFVLTNLDAPAQPMQHGRVVYWIDDADVLKGHVGHRITFSGTVKEIGKSEMEVKRAGGSRRTWVEIEGPGHQVKTTPERAGVATAGAAKETDIPTTLVQLDVPRVTMVSTSCK